MLRPRYPEADTYPITTVPAHRATTETPLVAHEPARGVVTPPTRPVISVTPATLVVGTGAVLVVGTVLVSLLLAVALSAGSLALLAVVLRSLSNSRHRTR